MSCSFIQMNVCFTVHMNKYPGTKNIRSTKSLQFQFLTLFLQHDQ